MTVPAEPPRGACPTCGYDLQGARQVGYEIFCPECGHRCEAWNLAGYRSGVPWSMVVSYLLFGVVGGAIIGFLLYIACGIWLINYGVSGRTFGSRSLIGGVIAVGVPAMLWAADLFAAWWFLRRSCARSGWPFPGKRARRHLQCIVIGQLSILALLVLFIVVVIILP